MAQIALSNTYRSAPMRVRGGLANPVIRAFAAWRERKQLGRLDGHLLRDIGVDAADAQREVNRPIWDVPTSWPR